MSLGGAAGGFALGFALALLMEMRDTSFHTEKDLTKHLAPPFVLGIPLLPTRAEERRQQVAEHVPVGGRICDAVGGRWLPSFTSIDAVNRSKRTDEPPPQSLS